MSTIKIKGRTVYRGEELIGKIVGHRFPEDYRRQRGHRSADFQFIPVANECERIDLSLFAYFQDACNWRLSASLAQRMDLKAFVERRTLLS